MRTHFTNEVEPLEAYTDLEFEFEINRSSRDYIKWVQSSLNRIISARLVVDGISGSQTRAAVQTFQRQKGLTADGIVGPITEGALIAAGAGQPPGGASGAPSSGTPGTGSPSSAIDTFLPYSGPGYESKYTSSDLRFNQYGRSEAILALQWIARAWQRKHPNGPKLYIGPISKKGGGTLCYSDGMCHAEHKDGLDIDIRPVRNDQSKGGLKFTDASYARQLTQELVDLAWSNRCVPVEKILFNDPAVSRVNYSSGHDDHLHVSFKAPSGSLPAECRSTGSGYGWELSKELEQDWEEFLDDFGSSFTKPRIEDRTAFTPKDRKIEFESPPSIIVDPVPSMADFVDLAREILRKRLDRKQGVVLSIVHMSSGDTKDLIDRRTEKGKSGRQVLKNPPAHLVMPPEVYEIEWKPKRGKPQKIQFVWVLSNEKSAFPVGGILFLTTVQIHSFYLATFNVGALDDKRCTNVHHAEMQATRFIVEQAKTWRERVGTIDIWNLSRKKGLGYSPCNPCCVDLTRFLTDLRALRGLLRRASITWLTLYDRNKPCGHPTDTANLREMARAGWQLNGPGWSVSGALVRLFPPDPPTIPITAPPNDVGGKDIALKLAGGTAAALALLQKWANTYRHAFAKAFADTVLQLSRSNWQERLTKLRSLSARGYKGLPASSASAVEWERWAPTQKALQNVSIELPTDDFAARFRWYERMLMFALAGWIRRRVAQADMNQAKAVALQQASAAGIASAVQYVRASGIKQWNMLIALIRVSGLSDDEISKRLEPLGVEQLPRLSGTATGIVARKSSRGIYRANL